MRAKSRVWKSGNETESFRLFMKLWWLLVASVFASDPPSEALLPSGARRIPDRPVQVNDDTRPDQFLANPIEIETKDHDAMCTAPNCRGGEGGKREISQTQNHQLLSSEVEECPDEGDAEQEILATLMRNYNKQSLPSKTGVLTHVEMHVNDIPALSELQSEFTLDLMYSEMWTDKRLAFSMLPIARCIRNITLDLDYLKKVWSPNTCIVNSKSATIHASPSDNVFLILNSDGSIWKNCRMMVKAPCQIDLRTFPFDTQKCTMVFESYSYNSQRVKLDWLEEAPITLMKKMELPDFSLVDYEAEKFNVEYPNGHWDQLKATFVFKRRFSFFILQAYVPTYMTIFVAWINFYMDPKELSTRATLGISAFLAITLQFGNILKNQPPVSYVKALDVWMLGCIIFLFVALAELAIISYKIRTDKPNARMYVNSLNPATHSIDHRNIGGPSKFYISPYSIDRFCVWAYPPLFLAFNIFYWCYFGPDYE